MASMGGRSAFRPADMPPRPLHASHIPGGCTPLSPPQCRYAGRPCLFPLPIVGTVSHTLPVAGPARRPPPTRMAPRRGVTVVVGPSRVRAFSGTAPAPHDTCLNVPFSSGASWASPHAPPSVSLAHARHRHPFGTAVQPRQGRGAYRRRDSRTPTPKTQPPVRCGPCFC